jgi:hypothetical protein
VSAARAALTAAAVLLASSPAPAAPAEHGAFLTVYERPRTSDYLVYRDGLARERFLESVAEELNRVLELPASVTLAIAECGHSTTRWDGAARVATLCYEFLDAVLVIAGDAGVSPERAEQLFSGAVTFALFAEVGRALVELRELPAPAGAERAGDEFAALTLAAAEHDGDTGSAAAVEFFDIALKQPDSGFEYLETHHFDRARLETVACLLYGNAPRNHGASLARGILPKARAPRCAEELLAVAKSWEAALKPYSKGPAATPAVPPSPN